MLRDGVLMSPDRGVLEGITRKTVVELSARLNIDCRLTKVPVDVLRKADEVFISSTAGGIMPVRSVDESRSATARRAPSRRASRKCTGNCTTIRLTARLCATSWLRSLEPACSMREHVLRIKSAHDPRQQPAAHEIAGRQSRVERDRLELTIVDKDDGSEEVGDADDIDQ